MPKRINVFALVGCVACSGNNNGTGNGDVHFLPVTVLAVDSAATEVVAQPGY